MKRRIYIYQEALSEEIISLFESIGENITIEQQEPDLLTILDQDYYNPEPIDLVSFHELIEEDFGGEVTIFISPYMEEDFVLGSAIKEFLKELPHGVFFFDDVITYCILRQKTDLKQLILEYIRSKVNQEVIHTVREFIENDLNSSLSAKRLYMHRNTLNYRIDNFIEATHINVKSFKGANAIYMLYKF